MTLHLLLSSALLAGGILILIIALYARRYRHLPLAANLGWLLAATAVYAIGYSFELTSATLRGMLFWSKVQYLGIPFITTLWLFFVSAFTGYRSWLTRPIRAALLGIAALTTLLHWAQSYHRLFYVNPRLISRGPALLMEADKGMWYWAYQIYNNTVLLICLFILIRKLIHSPAKQRAQSAVMVAGFLVPWAFYGLYLAGVGPRDFDLTPFGLVLAAPLFTWAVFGFKILNVAPIARATIIESLRDGLIVVDPEGRIVEINPTARQIFPGLDDTSVGLPLAGRLPGHPELAALLQDGAAPELELKVAAGESRRYYLVRRSPILSGRSRLIGYTLTLRDTTQQVLLKEKLQVQATVDDLTGTFNRRYFLELGRRETARSKRYDHAISVGILDLDRFKSVNDTWGHEAGDQVLRVSAATIRKALRDSDILGRHGGEEFAIVFVETSPGVALHIADRLRKILAETEIRISEETTVRVTASFGVAGIDRGEQTLDDLIRAADRAMYEAKESGRNCVRLASLDPR